MCLKNLRPSATFPFGIGKKSDLIPGPGDASATPSGARARGIVPRSGTLYAAPTAVAEDAA
eukprot:6618230-Prymnesium_polylepis.1